MKQVFLDLSESDHDRLMKTADLENFVAEFMNRCFTLIENTRCVSLLACVKDLGTSSPLNIFFRHFVCAKSFISMS
jgi:hypothetical protein